MGPAVADDSSLEMTDIPDQTVEAGYPVYFMVSATGPDPSLIQYYANGLPDGASFDEANGEFSWVPMSSDSGDHEMQFFATDGNVTVSDDVLISVASPAKDDNVNNEPLIQPLDPQTIEVGEHLSFFLAAADPDDDALTFSSPNLPSGADLDAATGMFEWTPAAGQGDIYDIEFMVSDGALSATTTGTITVTEAETNDPLEIVPIGSQSVKVGKSLQFTVSATGGDGAFTFSARSLPSGANFNPSTGVFEWTPSDSQVGTHSPVFTVTDGVDTKEVTVSITVTPAEAGAPLAIAPIGSQSVEIGKPLHFTVSASGGSGAFTFSSTALPSGANFNPSTASTAVFDWTPASGQAGTYTIDFTVSDESQSVTAPTVTITVKEAAPEANDPLTIASVGTKKIEVNKALEFKVTATGGNGTLTYSSSSLPSGATFNSTTHTFKWTPTSSQVGTYSPVFKVTDGADTKEVTVPITVTAASTGSGGSSSGGTGSSSTGTSSTGSSGSSGMFQPSNEKFENIVYKDFSIKYVLKDVENVFSFGMENNSIKSITIVTLLNEGETKAIVEVLKGTSTAVSKAAPGDVYKNVNIWVGDDKFSESNLKKAQVNFRVEKAWLSENGVDPASVKLLRYSGSWKQLPTSVAGEDETYVNYTAFTPGFSAFAISSVDESDFALNESENMSLSFDGDQGLNGTASADQERKSSWLILFILIGIAGVGLTGYMYKEQIRETLSNISNSDGKSYRRSK